MFGRLGAVPTHFLLLFNKENWFFFSLQTELRNEKFPKLHLYVFLKQKQKIRLMIIGKPR